MNLKSLLLIKIVKNILFIILFLFVSFSGKTQIKSIGIPNIVSYNRQDYNASTQNWATIQDKRGVLYFGNNDGILEFDGVNWRLIQIPNSSNVRSISTDKKGTIYVGAYEEFGYLEADKSGNLKYVSLIEKVPTELRNCGEIWKIYETESGIIFQSFTAIFLFKNDVIKVIAQKRDFHFSFYVNDELYITELNKGLLKLKDEKLIPVKGGLTFNNNVWTMLPLSNSKILIGTNDKGLFILEDETITSWDIPVNGFLKQNQIYSAALVKDYIALGTILNGLLIIDKNGNPIQHINREKGLQNNTILSIYADNYDNLWLGLDNGIDYVATNSPFTNIVDKSKIGAGYVSYIFQNKLYLGTNQGLYYKEWLDEDPLSDKQEFIIVENTQGQVWDIFEYENRLYCGHNHGTYIIINNKAELISDVMGGWLLLNLPDKEKTMLQGTYSGLLKYDLQNNAKVQINRIEGFNESCRSMELYLGKDYYTLWISHIYKGIFKIDLNKDLDKIIRVDLFNSTSGLLTDYDNNVLKFNDEIIFSNSNGIYNFNFESQEFILNKELMDLFGDKGILRKIVKNEAGNSLFIQGNKMGLIKRLSDGNYKVDRVLFETFAGSFIHSFEHLLPYKDENTIIATEEGFTHLNSNFNKDIDIPFHTLIRSVETMNDSLLFGGAFVTSSGNISSFQSDIQLYNLNFKYHNLKFEFSATHYENMNNIKYKYFLEGFEENWSEWTTKTIKEYTNLSEGSYSFKVKAINVYNKESEIASFSFVINPPWYRSVTAYIVYFLILCIISWLTIIFIKRRIEKERRFLKLGQEKELHQQKIDHENEVLSAQQEIVKLRNEKLRIENEKNRAEVNLKTKELASYAMQVTQKNESLFEIKEQLKHISQKVNPDAQKYLQKLIKNIEQSTNQKNDWDKFERYFDQVYEDFTKRLREKFSVLTPNDIKLCAYLRMNLSTKEIAPLLNISIRGVEISRYRLRKKLELPQSENLIDFMMNL